VLQHVRQCLARGTDPQMNLLVSSLRCNAMHHMTVCLLLTGSASSMMNMP
jgi:hypothetical protein